MEDKLFELLVKMYGAMQEGFGKSDAKIMGLENRMASLEHKMDQRFADLENKGQGHIAALHDGYKQNDERLTNIESKLENLSDQVAKQDVEIRVVKNIANK